MIENILRLKNIKEFVEQNNYEITIVGHTDSIGSNQYNFGLSRRRAEAVKAKLLEFGLAEDRIVGIEAMGEEQPIATNATKEGRVDGPTAWDGYVGQVTAKAASKARDTQTVVKIEMEEKPEFYK